MKTKTFRAFTLIELIVTVVILGITIPMISLAIVEGIRRNVDITVRTQATLHAQALVEEIRSKRFDESATPPWSGILGPDGGETRVTFDDVDDFEGLSESVPGFSGYTQTAHVRYVPQSNLNGTSASPTSYKQISVTVTGAQGVSITLTSLQVARL